MAEIKGTSKDVIAALRKRFDPPAWAFLEQVADGTGQNQKRWADAVAMSLWPSRGITFEGIEVKVSRGDWTRELANPAKAHSLGKYCHRWWLAVSDEKIVQPGELPPAWGLLALKGDKMYCKVEAPLQTPEAPTWTFLAGVMRSVSAASTEDLGKSWITGRAEGYEAGKKERDYIHSRAAEDLASLKGEVDAFHKASGIEITRYSGGDDLGKAVKFVMAGGRDTWSVDRSIDLCRRTIEGLEGVRDLFAKKEELAVAE